MRLADPQGMSGLLSSIDQADWSSDDGQKAQQLEALNRLYAAGEIDEDEYQEMLENGFAAAEKSGSMATAL